MSDNHQQEAAGWEWSQEDEQRWQAEQASTEKLASDNQIMGQMLTDFENVFMNEGE